MALNSEDIKVRLSFAALPLVVANVLTEGTSVLTTDAVAGVASSNVVQSQ